MQHLHMFIQIILKIQNIKNPTWIYPVRNLAGRSKKGMKKNDNHDNDNK